jgi:antitoxin component of MazEF toxin-antitoxin module
MEEHQSKPIPKLRLRYSLNELLAGVTPAEAHETSDEIDWGPDVGQEILAD